MAARELLSRLQSASKSSINAFLLRPYLGLFGDQVFDRFAIVGNARTGSNFLYDGLKSSSSVKMYHEIFAAHNRDIGKGFEKTFSMLYQKEKKGTRLVGFKLFYNHLTEDEWKAFLAHREFKIVHLTRENRLRTIVSLDIAFKTGEWTKSRQAKQKETKDRSVFLDTSNLMGRLERIQNEEVLARERFKDRRLLEVVYETLTAQPVETFERIGQYLGIHDIDPNSIKIRRQNPEPLERLITNYEEVHRLLKKTAFSGYLDT